MRIAVIVPAGPRDDTLDTLASVVLYTRPPRVILVVDDTGDPRAGGTPAHGTGATPGHGSGGTPGHPAGLDRARELSPDITVIPAPPGAPGSQGGLWVKLAAGYRWVLDRYEPRIVLRLDADALLIRHGVEQAAEEVFGAAPGVGLLGSYLVGPDGQARDISWAARTLRAEAGLRGLRHRRVQSTLRRSLGLARRHGYIDGENVLGGAYIHRLAAVRRMHADGLFSQPWLAASRLGEDHIMALLTMAAGYRIADFGGPADPLALRWQGLPAHPADLLAAGKLVVHSVRSFDGLTEPQIRAIFAQARAENSGAAPVPG